MYVYAILVPFRDPDGLGECCPPWRRHCFFCSLTGQLDRSLPQGGGLVLQQGKDRREHVDERSEWASPLKGPWIASFYEMGGKSQGFLISCEEEIEDEHSESAFLTHECRLKNEQLPQGSGFNQVNIFGFVGWFDVSL